ncbi:MAG: methylated-DNA--[protein]-cysteine S-methyltransferase [Planctomycetota bacterium]|nr:MAG: methylated-DNA--[protein]-cysteine S-methyltransferase [Planctomycetota bacterium]
MASGASYILIPMEPLYQDEIASPFGTVRFLFQDDGSLAEIHLPGCGCPEETPLIRRRPAGAPTKAELKRWLKQALVGGAEAFPGRWQLPGNTPFMKEIYRRVAAIPAGQALSYGEVAAAAGRPKAARAVGSAMSKNPLPILIPCHRVIGSDGSLTGFGGGLALKERMLVAEGWQPALKAESV